MSEVVNMRTVKKERERQHYADLVMKTWRDFEHIDKRSFLERRAEVEQAARERL